MLRTHSDFGFEPGSDFADIAAELRRSAARAVADPAVDSSPRFASLGWLSIATTTDCDAAGRNVGLRLVCSLAEQLGYSGVTVSLASVGVMPSVLLAHCADGPLRNRLRSLAEESCAAVVLANPSGDCRPVATGSPDHGVVLDGLVEWITPASADVYLVVANSVTGPIICAIPASAHGLAHGAVERADGTPAGVLSLNAVEVTPEHILATREQAATAVGRAQCAGLMACAAELGGVSRRALDLTLEYVDARRQFGRRIGEYQVVQHRLVDMWLDCQLAGAALDAGLRVLATGSADDNEHRRRASSAKARAALSARQVCDAAVQLHGAIGFTQEYELGWYVNRSLVLSAWLGNAREHTRQFAALSATGSAQ